MTSPTSQGRLAMTVAAASLVVLSGCGGARDDARSRAAVTGAATTSAGAPGASSIPPANDAGGHAIADVRRACERIAAPAAEVEAETPAGGGRSGTARRPARRGAGSQVSAVELQRATVVSGTITTAIQDAPPRERGGLVALRAAYDALRAAAGADRASADGGQAVSAARAGVDAVAERLAAPECRATPAG